MKRWMYTLLQCTWGFPQTVLGLMLLCTTKGCTRGWYRGVLVTEWNRKTSVSLGMFVFVSKRPERRFKQDNEVCATPVLVHEYGHTVQSGVLGPLYLPIVGLPSIVWCGLPVLERRRQRRSISYYSFYTERWANAWGERITGAVSLGQK